MGLPAVRSRKRPIQQSSINNPDAFPSALCEGKSIRIRKKHNIARRDGDEHENKNINGCYNGGRCGKRARCQRQTKFVNISESDYETGVYLRAYVREDFLTMKPIGRTASVYSKKQSETDGGIVGEGKEVGGLW